MSEQTQNRENQQEAQSVASAAPLRAITIGYAPSTASRSPERSAWLRQVSREVHASRREAVAR